MAIAGAAKVAVPQAIGYMPREGDILSSSGQCRPFDANASGTIHGSGGGVIILKRLVDAIQDEDQIHAVIRGSAVNNDGSSKIGYTAPGMQGQANVIMQAMAAANVEPTDVDYVEAHGTGTSLGDPIEIMALKQAFGNDISSQSCGLGSVKGNIGHLDVAAGIASVIKVVLAMKHRKLPPSLHFESANKEIDFASSPFFVNAELREWSKSSGLRTAGISAFGIGGSNAHLVLEELDPKHIVGGTGNDPLNDTAELFCLSAQSTAGLKDYATRYVDFLQNDRECGASSLADICLTSQVARPHFAVRHLVRATSKKQLLSELKNLKVAVPTVSLRDQAPVVVFMFTGQGSQYSGMARELYENDAVFRRHFDEISYVVSQKMTRKLEYYIWQAPQSELDDTRVTQLVLLGLELALANYWDSMGIRPDYLIGHSIGEIVAACFSGMLSLKDAVEVVCRRADAMNSADEGGAMLAVAASETQLDSLLDPFTSLSIAAVNAPDNTVISGDRESIDRLEKLLQEKSVKSRRLRVSRAFHSSQMDAVLPVFESAIANIAFNEPKIPIISTVTPTIPNIDMTSSAYWVNQIREPVQFQNAVRLAQQYNANVFLEVGPQPTLTNFGRQSLNEHAALWLPSLSQRRPDCDLMFSSLAQFYESGGELKWAKMFERDKSDQHIARRVALPSFPFQRTRQIAGAWRVTGR